MTFSPSINGIHLVKVRPFIEVEFCKIYKGFLMECYKALIILRYIMNCPY